MIKEMCKVLDELNHSIRQSQARRRVHTFQQTLYLACSVHTRVGRGAGIPERSLSQRVRRGPRGKYSRAVASCFPFEAAT